MRSPFILAGLVMCLIGFSINISTVPNGVKYFGTFFVVAGAYAPFPGVVAWSVSCHSCDALRDKADCFVRLGGNLSGQYKRGIGMAIHIGIGNFSGAIASNIYRTQDKPRFALGRKPHSYLLMIPP